MDLRERKVQPWTSERGRCNRGLEREEGATVDLKERKVQPWTSEREKVQPWT